MSVKRHEIEEPELQGLKYFKAISQTLERLHDAGCARDRAHNRKLHMDQYMMLLLLYLFNPICVSLRSLQQASTLKKVQKTLGVPRSSLGSLSEATGVFDSELLVELIGDLSAQLKPISHDARLEDLGAILTLVDGTLLKALPKMTWALWQDEEHRGVKAHVQFELLKGVPISAVITEGNGNEKDILSQNLQPGRFYVIDRGYCKFTLFQQMIDIGSSFVGRINDNSVYEIIQEKELSGEAKVAGILWDRVVRLGSKDKKDFLKQPVRILAIQCKPHPRRAAGRGPSQGEILLIATDRLDLPAEVLALIYQNRWAVEIFFRFFKHVLGCRHLLSLNKNGIELQTYAAIIACLLIALWTGRKPALRTYEMISYYLMGWAGEDELLAHIAKLQKQD